MAQADNTGVKIERGVCSGAPFEGLATVEMRSATLRLVIVPERGGRVMKVIHLASGRDFVNAGAGGKFDPENGIYERITPTGRVGGGQSADRFAAREYAVVAEGGRLTLSRSEGTIRVERTLALDPRLPRLRIALDYTNVGDAPVKTQIFPIYQFNTNADRSTLYDTVVFPDSTSPSGFMRYPEVTQEFHLERQHGWFFQYDRRSRECVVVTHRPNDPSVEGTYAYKVAPFLHMVVLGSETALQPGEKASLVTEMWFLTAAECGEPEFYAPFIGDANARALSAALAAERGRATVSGGEAVEPKVDAAAACRAPVEKPLATLARVCWSGFYGDEQKDDFLLALTPRRLREVVAEVNAFRPDALIVHGGAHNGLDSEYAEAKRITACAQVPVHFAAGTRDSLDTFEKTMGATYRRIPVGPVSVFLLPPWARLSAERKATILARMKADMAAMATGERGVIVCSDPPRIRQADGTNKTVAPELAALCAETAVSLYLTGCGTNFLQRDGNATVVGGADLCERGTYQIVRVYRDRIEVDLAKPVGGNFTPVVRRPDSRDGGLPPGETRRADYVFAHFADTQLNDAQADAKSAARSLGDAARFAQLIAETNRLQPAFLLNLGDIVEAGVRDAPWETYRKLAAASRCPIYTAFGNHDASTDIYARWTGEQPLRVQRAGPDAFLVIHNDAESISRGADFSPEMWRRIGELAAQCRGARHLFLVSHYPWRDMPGRRKDMLDFVSAQRPTLWLAGHTHVLEWQWAGPTLHVTANSIGWTKEGPSTAYTGFFLNYVYPEKVVVVYKPLYEDVCWSVEVPNPRNPR